MVNRSRPFGEHEWSSGEAKNRFIGPSNPHRERELDEACPECGSNEFAHWRTNNARLSDYDYCAECGYGRAYMATG